MSFSSYCRVDEAFARELTSAFESALPADDAAEQRKERGGGDAVALLLQRRGDHLGDAASRKRFKS